MAIKKFLFMNETEGFAQPQGTGDGLFGLELNTLQITLESGQAVAVNAGGGRITDLAQPVNPNDAFRLVDHTTAAAVATQALADEVSARISGDAALAADLATEVARATAAEGVLAADLASEVARAVAAEGVLTTNLANEVSRAQAAELVLTQDLASEVSRATLAESTLTTNLSNEISRAQAAEATIASNLANEVLRAQGAESTIASNLANEVSRAMGAELVLTNDLLAEVARATAAEGVLTTNLAAEVVRAQGAEAELASDISDENARAVLAEGVLTTDLANEISRAISAEGVLTTNLSNEISRAQAAESTIASNLANEISRATAAEGVLTTNLSNEISRAQAAESTIASNLANEILRATAAEGVLTADLASEVSRAIAAEGVLTSNLATEVQARIDGDAATLQSAQSYAMSLQAGFIVKKPVKAVSAADIEKSGFQTIDGVSLVAEDRILLVNQANAADNGIYVVAAGAWSRSDDADSSAEVKDGMSVYVEQGTVYHDSTWVLITNNAITLGTTELTFERFSGLGQISSGDGLVQVGQNTLAVGAGHGIQVDADSVTVKLDGSTLSKSASGVKVLGLPDAFTVNGVATASGYVTAANLSAVCYPVSTNVHYHDKTVLLVGNGDGVQIIAKAAYISDVDGANRPLVRVASCTSAATSRVSGLVDSLGAGGVGMSLYTHGPASVGMLFDFNTAYYLGKDGTPVPFSGHAQSPTTGDRVIRLGYGMGGRLHVDIQDMGVKSA